MSEEQASVVLDEERQRKAKAYSRLQRRLLLVDLALGGLYLVLWLATGWHVALREWLSDLTSSPPIVLLLYGVVFFVPYIILSLPLSYYSGYVLPHRYEQSNQTLPGWAGDQVKSLALSGGLGILLIEIVYGLLRAAPDLWWLYAAGVMLFFTVVLSTAAPVLIAPLFFKFTPLDDEVLTQRLVNLAERAGIEVKGVYRFDMSTRTKSANAAVMGLGATRRIVLGDTLLDAFAPDEIETILAHELAHIVHRDMLLLILVNSALTLLSLWAASFVLRWGIGAFRLAGMADPAGLPLLGLTVAGIGLVAMPLGNAFSRWRESMADSFALNLTGKPCSFANAMIRLANQNLAEYDPERWEVILLYSHPPLVERIDKARAFAAGKA